MVTCIEINMNWDLQMNTKLVLGLNRAKQLGIKEKTQAGVIATRRPPRPLPGMIMITDSKFFFGDRFPYYIDP